MLQFFEDYFEFFILLVFVILFILVFFPFFVGDKIEVNEFYLIGDKVEFIYNNEIYRYSSDKIKLSNLNFSYFYFESSIFGLKYKSCLYLCIDDYEKLFGDINEIETQYALKGSN